MGLRGCLRESFKQYKQEGYTTTAITTTTTTIIVVAPDAVMWSS